MTLDEKTANEIMASIGIELRILTGDSDGVCEGLWFKLGIDASNKCYFLTVIDPAGKNAIKRRINPIVGIFPHIVWDVATRLGLDATKSRSLVDICLKAYEVFRQRECVEFVIEDLRINGDRIYAKRPYVSVDDNAQNPMPSGRDGLPIDIRLNALGMRVKEFDGNICVVANGPGILQSTVDVITDRGGTPGICLDIGGGPTIDALTEALTLFIPLCKRVTLVNVFGGLTRCDDVATAMIKTQKALGRASIVARFAGAGHEEGLKMMEASGLEAFISVEQAVSRALSIAGK